MAYTRGTALHLHHMCCMHCVPTNVLIIVIPPRAYAGNGCTRDLQGSRDQTALSMQCIGSGFACASNPQETSLAAGPSALGRSRTVMKGDACIIKGIPCHISLTELPNWVPRSV